MELKTIKNQLCNLHILENMKKKKFDPERIFFLESSKKCIRGNHAHKKCTQVFLSLKGDIKLFIKNKKSSKKLILKEFGNIIKILPMNWVKIEMKKNQLLMVICDKKFSEKDYLRDYSIFLKKLKK
tara:strand:+ start:137 stop:514 length:378 start_codon:yes stop_codon:yes gene_type:complete